MLIYWVSGLLSGFGEHTFSKVVFGFDDKKESEIVVVS